jgi:hypothetical protein
MSQEIVGIKIQVGGQEKVLATMGDLRKEIKQAQFDVLKFSQEFGETSKEALAAAKRVAELKDAIADASEKVALFDPGKKFQVVGNAVTALAGGFSAVQGALGLVGVESENVQKSLLKVQSALALSQGLSTIADSAKDFERLGAIVKNTTVFQTAYNFVIGKKVALQTQDAATTAASTVATKAQAAATNTATAATTASSTAMKIFRGAILATGVGALVVGLIALVQNFGKIKAAVLNAIPGLGSFASTVGNVINAFTDLVGITNAASRAEQQRQAIFTKAAAGTKIINEGIDRQIKLLQAQGAEQGKIDALRKQSIQNELKDLTKLADQKGILRGEDAKKYKDLQNDLAVIDATAETARRQAAETAAKRGASASNKYGESQKKKDEDLAKERLAAEKEAAERLNQLKADTAVAAIENEFEAKKLAIENALAAEIKQVNDNEKLKLETKNALILALTNKSNLEIAAVNKDAAEKAKAAKEKTDKEEKDALLKQQEDDRKIRQLGFQEQIEAINKENAKIEMDFEQDLERLADKKQILREQELLELENTELTELQKTEIKKKYADARAEVTNQEVATEKAAQQAKIDLNNRYLELAGQFGGVLQQIAGKNKALAIAGVVVEQAASIGRIISNTGVANAKAVAASPLTAGQPFVAINSISAGLSIASSVAAGLKAVQQINSAQPGGGGGASPVSGGGAAAPIAPAAPIPNTVTQLDQQSVNAMGSATNRAYVVESDVTNKQERITRINRAARLS